MKSQSFALGLAAGAVALLLAGCGGGGGDDTSADQPDPTLQVSGTAATGAALANATVEVKCASGTGTATTNGAGAYTVTITKGALPCLIEVKGTVGTTAVSLHSVVEAGTLDAADGRTTAVANVTPITEMIVAQLAAAMPEDSFKGFKGEAITPAQVEAATAAVLAALKGVQIDLGTIDPLKAELVAGASRGKGNAYDNLLDALGDKIQPASLPVVVNQIALSAVTKSEDGLSTAMAAVSGGNLPGCPAAVSGKYRTLDHFGRLITRTVDFAGRKFQAANGVDFLTITFDAAKPCEFTASGTVDGRTSETQVVMGPSGVGSYRTRFLTPEVTVGTVGTIFPVQSHSYSTLRGTWSFLQSGFMPGDGLVHLPGQVTFGEERKVTVCDYDTATWACVADASTLTATERSDGGFDVASASDPGVALYAYRAPNGSVALFGTTNSAGVNDATTIQTTLVGGKLSRLAVPPVGTVAAFWDTGLTIFGNGTSTTNAPLADSNTVIASDAATSTVRRKRASDGREDTVHYNQPLDGLRTRDAGTFGAQNFASVVQVAVPGMGFTWSVNTVPAGPTSAYIANISVTRP